jgi:CheY-like chemotaxis protein
MTFELEEAMPIPMIPAPTQDGASAQEIDAYPNARVLIAEDDLVNRSILVSMLKRFQIVPDVAVNGREALACCIRGTYHLVLMDHRMPVMDGIEATIAIRDHERNTPSRRVPVVAVSANASAEDFRQFTAAGMDALLKKPLRLADLGSVLHRWIGEGGAVQSREGPAGVGNSPA